MKRRLSRTQGFAGPHQAWNAFIELLAMEGFEALDPSQRSAHLAFWYDAEVQKGGHLQYFSNSHGARAAQTVAALEELGAHRQGANLTKAMALAAKLAPNTFDTSRDFLDAALEDAYCDFDRTYADSAPTVTELLDRHLKFHEPDFIEWTP